MHLNSELLFRKYASPLFLNNIKVLEIGPAGFPSAFQKVINNNSIEWHTIDFAETTFISNAVDKLTYKLSNPYNFPVESGVYDIVLSGQVIEHVEKIWDWLKEIKRVLKDGGIVITINPVSWPYHEAPIDCWRIFPNGMKALAQEVGLNVEMCQFESLETEQILEKDAKAKFLPGKSYNYNISSKKVDNILRWNKVIRRISGLKNYLEIPIEVSYDTISVLKK